MSSPALTLDDEDPTFDDYNICQQCKLKSSNINAKTRFLSCSCYLNNFPNVGSSPVFDENSEYWKSVDCENKESIEDNFGNLMFDDDSEDDAKNEENMQVYDENDIEDDLERVNNEEQTYDDYEEETQEFDEQEQETKNEKDEWLQFNQENNYEKEEEDEDDVDEIIIHNTIENSKILPIEPSFIDTNIQKKSIIKKSSCGILKQISNSLDDPLITQQNTLSNEKIAQINHNENLPSTNHAKPKVRFNLDLKYEKEREWSRINKILGDVSKSTIEWTDEVEV
jgi:hypothetical protein